MTRTSPHLPVLLSLVGLGLVPSSEARAQAFACGANITTNATLTADVVCAGAPPGGTALNIGANNITVNFNGFRVLLNGSTGFGVRAAGRSNVTLNNVRVDSATARTGTGIYVSNSSNVTITNANLSNGGSGLARGIDTAGTNSNLDISGSNVTANRVGMYLVGLDATSSVTGSTFTNALSGILLLTGTNGLTIDAADGNVFTNTGVASPSSEGIRLQGTTGVTLDGLNLGGSQGIGVRLDGANSGTILSNLDLTGRRTGIVAGGATDNTNLTISGNNFTNAIDYGVNLDSVNSTLVLTGNNFAGAGRGTAVGATAAVRIQDLVGPWTLDASNTFAGAAATANASVVILNNTQAVTLDGLPMSGTTGTGVYLSGTTNTTLSNNNLSGRRFGIDTTTTVNPGLTVTGNNVSGSAVLGMRLQGVNASLVLTGNTFSNSASALQINSLAGPWTLSGTNVFTNVASGATAMGVRFVGGSNVTVDGVNLSRAGGAGYGLKLESVTGFDVVESDFSGRARGIFVDGTNIDLSIRNNDVSDATDYGIHLTRVSGLDLLDNDYSNDRNGVRIDLLTNTATLDFAGSFFDNIGTTSTHNAVFLSNSSNVTLTDLRADMVAGTAVRVDGGSNVTVTDLRTCFANIGVDFNSVTNSFLQNSQIGNDGPVATTYGLDVSAGGGHTFRDSSTFGVTALRDVGASPATATSNLGAMIDEDGDGIPDLCDVCPTDPANGSPCAVNGCAGGDGVTDADADGWCAGTNPGDDCDDTRATVYPNAPELCDGLDNDCFGVIDEGSPFGDTDNDTCDDCGTGPFDPANDGPDNEGDGLCDAGDPDDDNDTVVDGSDRDPLNEFVCQDSDLDDCDDCSVAGQPQPSGDGTDTDSDGFCNTSDFSLQPTVLVTRPSWNTLGTAGAGSPTVVWDTTPATDHYVMVYETQTAANGTGGCAGGVWTLGVTTSTDGVNWTDAGSALVSNASYYSCVAAQPTAVRQTGSANIVVYFKAEDTTGFTGVGRLVMTWNGSGYTVSSVDPSPVLANASVFGSPKAVYDSAIGQYRMAYAQRPDMYVTSGSGTSFPAGTVALARNFAPWAPDEVINPAVACQADGSYHLYVGGRDFAAGSSNIIGNSMGRRQSARGDFATWSPGPGALVDLVRGDPLMRHWDVLRAGGQHLMFFSERQGGNGPVQIRMAYTGTAQPTPSDTNDKVCQ